jgi:uncharacterized membrane protein YjgN (DUF898 family)
MKSRGAFLTERFCMNEGIAPSTPGASSAPRARAAFTGENGEFRGLVARGASLELVTFGFYRFWLATNIRRHLWSNSSVAGEALYVRQG